MRAARIATATTRPVADRLAGNPAAIPQVAGEEAAADIARSDRLTFMDQSGVAARTQLD